MGTDAIVTWPTERVLPGAETAGDTVWVGMELADPGACVGPTRAAGVCGNAGCGGVVTLVAVVAVGVTVIGVTVVAAVVRGVATYEESASGMGDVVAVVVAAVAVVVVAVAVVGGAVDTARVGTAVAVAMAVVVTAVAGAVVVGGCSCCCVGGGGGCVALGAPLSGSNVATAVLSADCRARRAALRPFKRAWALN